MENIFVSGRTQALPASLHSGSQRVFAGGGDAGAASINGAPQAAVFRGKGRVRPVLSPLMHASLTTPCVYNQTLGGRDVNPRGKAARRAAMARAAEQRLKVGVHCCGHQDTRTAF